MIKNKQSQQLAAFRQLIIQHFSEAELRTLCFDLGHDYELLPGREKSEKARELIAYYRRINRLNDLLQVCQKTRPQVEWPPLDIAFLSPAQVTTQKKTFGLGVGLLVIIGVAFLVFMTRTFWLPQDKPADSGQTLPALSTNCFDTYLADIPQDYQATVAVGETAHDFYFTSWGDRENPSLLGLRLTASGEIIAAVRFLFLPASTPGSTAFEIVGVIDENCQEVGTFSQSSQVIKNWDHINLELPEKAITVSFNWQGDHIRWGVRQLGAP